MKSTNTKLINSAIALVMLMAVSCSTLVEPTSTKVEADFSARVNNILVGQSVSFDDESDGNPSSWEWAFPGGTPAISSLQNPSVVYDVAGQYNVTLRVADAFSENTETKTAYIHVIAGAVADLNGFWESSDGLQVIEIINGSGYFQEINGGTWLSALNLGFVSLGDLRVKNIVQRVDENGRYNCEWLWNRTINSYVVEVKFSTSTDSGIELQSTNEFQLRSQIFFSDGTFSSLFETYTRKN